jgi:hypothetical protein
MTLRSLTAGIVHFCQSISVDVEQEAETYMPIQTIHETDFEPTLTIPGESPIQQFLLTAEMLGMISHCVVIR